MNVIVKGSAARIEALAREVEQHEDYRVLRCLQPRRSYDTWDGEDVIRVAIVDTETTGMNHKTDEIIELGLVVVAVDAVSGRAFEVLESFGELEQPTRPIPPETTRIHGITDTMVAGKRIDDRRVEAALKDVSVVVAHNARFDRRFLEKRLPVFSRFPWACSVKEVRWREEGLGSQKLDYILSQFGFFHEAHRAEADCLALLEVLQQPLHKSGTLGMQQLLHAREQQAYRIWAQDAPFDCKDRLKALGYRWDANKRCWNLEVSAHRLEQDLLTLKEVAYPCRPSRVAVEALDATVRFSDRAGKQEIRVI